MSYGIEILVKVEDGPFVIVATQERDSPTYNLGKMFRMAMAWDFKQGVEYNVDSIFPKILHGIVELEYNPEEYRKYEPENKWGTVESALDDLKSLRDCINGLSIDNQHLHMRW